MASPMEESKIIKQVSPSLFHIASVKVALLLCREFDYKDLLIAFDEIKHKTSTTSSEDSEQNHRTDSREKKSWLFIPAHLRQAVWRAINGLELSIALWKVETGIGECNFYIRPDGTIDRMKTVQDLVLDVDINIKNRFEVACNYCLEKSIQTLWSEMELSGDVENFETAESSMARFWINRIHHGSEVPWTQAVLDYIASLESPRKPLPRFSSFFPFLHPKERQKCLMHLSYLDSDDFLFCLYALTKKEEEKIMQTDAIMVLVLYFQWPLQDLFLETVEKMWKIIDAKTFYKFVKFFIEYLKFKVHHFDYRKLFVSFWQRSPNHLKEIVNEYPDLRKSIDSYLN